MWVQGTPCRALVYGASLFFLTTLPHARQAHSKPLFSVLNFTPPHSGQCMTFGFSLEAFCAPRRMPSASSTAALFAADSVFMSCLAFSHSFQRAGKGAPHGELTRSVWIGKMLFADFCLSTPFYHRLWGQAKAGGGPYHQDGVGRL